VHNAKLAVQEEFAKKEKEDVRFRDALTVLPKLENAV
jgi:hypothetical protein